MIFNFSKQHQFISRIQVNSVNIDVVKEAKLLGVIITDKLTWDKNTNYLVRKAFMRMKRLIFF